MSTRVSNDSPQWLSPESDTAEPVSGSDSPPKESWAGLAGDVLEAYSPAADAGSAHTKTIAAEARTYESPLFLASKSDREQLAMTSQSNDLSKAAGNEDRICGGAAAVNALILASTDAKACKANSAALAASAKALGASEYLPACVSQKDVDTALEAMANGNLRPTDVAVLQQLAYALARATQDGQDTGTSPGAMTVITAQLLGAGARLGDTKFTLVEDEKGNAHWVATTNKKTANSLGEGSIDDAGTALKELAPYWAAEVAAGATVQTRMNGGGAIDKSGKPYRLHLDSADFRGSKAPDLERIDKQLRRQLEERRS